MILKRIALISDNAEQQALLMRSLVDDIADVIVCLQVSDGTQPLMDFINDHGEQRIDAWLLHLSDHHDGEVVDILCDHSDKPILVNDSLPIAIDCPEYTEWRRRLHEKIEQLTLGSLLNKPTESPVADTVWVLAASLGGPAMVKRFLQALPAQLPLGFIYVQHIDNRFDRWLAEGIGNRQHYPAQLIDSEHVLKQGATLIVPADYQLRFLPFGQVIKTQRQWQGSFQPCIDQVIAEVAKQYRQNMGVIIFSGTCNDGEVGCRVVKACGGQVWAQSLESCVSSAMPEAAVTTGSVTYQGNPEQLAQQLAQIYSQSAVNF